ncbi:MAG: hypothetical protein ABIH48_00955 [Candidatus Falkowbacteria bacterium]
MSIIKKTKDQTIKLLFGKSVVPRGLFELNQYFRINDPIGFDVKKSGDGLVAVSNNFRHGSIVTSGKDKKELDKNIKDAILTSFEIPSSYSKEARIMKEGERQDSYVLA